MTSHFADTATDQSFSLVLGAGGARGLAHIPIIEALDELGLKPVAIAGTSIGSIIGVCYAAGMSGQDIRAFFLDVVARRKALAGALMTARVGRLKDMRTFGNPFLIDGEKLLKKYWPDSVPQSFEELDVPISVVTADFHARSELVFNTGPLRPAVAASMAIPGAFQPVEHQGRILIDGGTINPLPFDLLRNRTPLTVAVDVIGGPGEEMNGQPSGFEIVFGALQLLQGAIVSEKLKVKRPEILIRPPIDSFRVLNFFAARKILEACEPIKDEFKRKIEAHMNLRMSA